MGKKSTVRLGRGWVEAGMCVVGREIAICEKKDIFVLSKRGSIYTF